MITKEIKDKVFNALDSYKTDMNNFIEDNKTIKHDELFKKFDNRNRLVSVMPKHFSGLLKSKIDDILNDLRASVRCGYVDKEEAELYITTCQEVVSDTEKEYIEYIENYIGEKRTLKQAEEAYE